ncbi:diguanylate cyclase, partial [Aquabacterium sp.]|uniref:diguanylate cyclase domain-containing protein n=1 Tax=Aquabacterium sp. TaxID=1872578 RepID=UPI0019B3D29C
LDEAMAVAAALCEGVRAAHIEHKASTVSGHVTVSVGAALAWPAQGGGAQSLVAMADRALYGAKEGGRDRACADNAVGGPPQAQPVAARQEEAASEPKAGEPAVVALPASAEAGFAHTLKGKFIKLRFPAEQEAAYREHDADQRRKQLALMSVVGLMIYNVYLLANRSMFPDIQTSTLLWMVGLCAVLLLLSGVAYVAKVPILWHEAIFSLGTSIVGVASAWLLSQSTHLTAIACSVCLVLIPMFSGVGARQPFWFTCVPAVITCVAASLFLHPVGDLQKLVFLDTMLMIVNNTSYTLILAYMLEYGSRKEWLLSHIERYQRQSLVTATERLHEMSILDPLTGICNRRQFEEDFQRLWLDSLYSGKPLAMLIIDVDFFKLFNDGYGHPMGDRCLKQVAAAISQTAQEGLGLTARLGGEEFGILLPGANAKQATELGERVCAAVRNAAIEHRFSQVPGHPKVTVSVGAASVVAQKRVNRRTLFAMADDALYQAKHAGRNRVATLTGPAPSPLKMAGAA